MRDLTNGSTHCQCEAEVGYKGELPLYMKLKFILAENEDPICHLFRKAQ